MSLDGTIDSSQMTEDQRAKAIADRVNAGGMVSIVDRMWAQQRYPQLFHQITLAYAQTHPFIKPSPSDVQEAFWTEQGYPQYKGYTQPNLPAGSTITRVTEGGGGLNIEYTTPRMNADAARAEAIGLRMVSGGPVSAKESVWLGKNYPEYTEKVAEARAAGARAETIGQSYLAGSIGPKEKVWLGKNYPDYAEQLVSAKASGVRAEKVGGRFLAGGFNVKDMVWLSKNYPDYAQTLLEAKASGARAELIGGKVAAGEYVSAKEAVRLGKEFPEYAAQVGEARVFTLESLKATAVNNAATKLSTDFYTEIGHPELAGKFAPFEVPRGFVLKELRFIDPSEGTIGKRGAGAEPRLEVDLRLETHAEILRSEGLRETSRSVTHQRQTLWEKVGGWLSETVSIGGPPSFTKIGGKQTFPDYGLKLTRGEALTAIATLNLPFAAPAALPFLGLSSTGIIASAGVSVGVSEAVSLITSGQHISLSQAISSALIGEALTIGSSSVLKGASKIPKIGPVFTRSITESLTASGLRGVATSVASRAAIFSAFGAATGYALSGGDIKQATVGAISGAAFSAGGDILKYGVERGYIPVPKYGKVNIPYEIEGEEGVYYTQQPTWRGIYLSRGEKANILIGKFSDFPESMGSVDDELAGVRTRIASHGVSGEELGWKPVSNIESEVTLKTMSRMGYGSQTIEDIGSFRQIMSTTQYTKSKFIEDMLPSETGTLGEKGVSSLKDYVLRNKGQVEELYGSFGTRPQLSTEFEYTLTTPSGDVISALRTPADIDIQLGTSGLGKASKFASDLSKVLERAGETVRISSESPTMIEADVGGKWAHAVDIHYAGEPNADLISAGGWGYKYTRPTTQIEKLPVMSLSEQGLRKGADSILGFNYDMSIGPVAHRLKDIPDFFQVQATLLESARPSGKVVEAQSLLSGLAERYNVSLSDLPPIGERYIVSGKPTVFQSTPIMVSPQAFASIKTGYSSQTVSMKAISPSISYISVPSTSKLNMSPSVKIGSVKTSLPSLISPSASSPRLVATLTSPMLTSAPKESVGASKIYGSLSRLVTPSSYASTSKLMSPKPVSSTPSSSLSAFSKSLSQMLSPSRLTRPSYPSSLSKMFSHITSPYPSLYPPPSTYPSPSPRPSTRPYPSYPSPSPSPSPSPYYSPSSPPSTTVPPPPKIRLPTSEFKKFKRRFGVGEWFKRSHPVLEPKQVFSQFWGGSLSKANLKTWKVGVHKTKRSLKTVPSEPIIEERLQIFTPGKEYSYDSGWVSRSRRRK